MEHSEGTFQGTGKLNLYYQCWRPEGYPRALIALVHGFGEHSGRYQHVVDHLVDHGFGLYGFDLRGHGRSPGQRGHINNWGEYRADVKAFIEMIQAEEPGEPVFLMAHSMGALIGLDYIQHDPGDLHGAIISGAPIEPVGAAKPLLVIIARALSKIWPGFGLKLGLDTHALSTDPEVVRAYEQDPLVHGQASARWGTETLNTINWVKANVDKITIPVLFIHGELDAINDVDGVKKFYEAISFGDKSLHIYPGTYHEAHNDRLYEQVVHDITEWVSAHLDAQPVSAETAIHNHLYN
jgi:alpha-beta hydrolase superfamily lysophospholipase